ncbi:MAG TPA: glutaredoxin family protein [Thermodesulfobacteriota bacterium]|nr:glutaredoxin family protein [Thermodesulfobacteriota bacterium]
MTRLVVEVFARPDCSPCGLAGRGTDRGCRMCKEVRDVISRVNGAIPFHFKEVDITVNEDLLRRYREDIPTVFINGKKAFKFKVDESEFRKRVRKEIIKAGISRLNSRKTNQYAR